MSHDSSLRHAVLMKGSSDGLCQGSWRNNVEKNPLPYIPAPTSRLPRQGGTNLSTEERPNMLFLTHTPSFLRSQEGPLPKLLLAQVPASTCMVSCKPAGSNMPLATPFVSVGITYPTLLTGPESWQMI